MCLLWLCSAPSLHSHSASPLSLAQTVKANSDCFRSELCATQLVFLGRLLISHSQWHVKEAQVTDTSSENVYTHSIIHTNTQPKLSATCTYLYWTIRRGWQFLSELSRWLIIWENYYPIVRASGNIELFYMRNREWGKSTASQPTGLKENLKSTMDQHHIRPMSITQHKTWLAS